MVHRQPPYGGGHIRVSKVCRTGDGSIRRERPSASFALFEPRRDRKCADDKRPSFPLTFDCCWRGIADRKDVFPQLFGLLVCSAAAIVRSTLDCRIEADQTSWRDCTRQSACRFPFHNMSIGISWFSITPSHTLKRLKCYRTFSGAIASVVCIRNFLQCVCQSFDF